MISMEPLSIQFPDLYLFYDFVEHHIIKCKKTTEVVNRDHANFIFPFQDLGPDLLQRIIF